MKIERFEDAEVWRLSRDFAGKIYLYTGTGKFAKDYSFRDQIRRSAVSIMSNIAEGFERQTNKEMVQFLFIAKGSAAESRSQLYLSEDVGYLDTETVSMLMENIISISKSLSGFIKYLKASI